MADLSQLSDEQLHVYRDLIAKKQTESAPMNLSNPGAPGSSAASRFASGMAAQLNPIPGIRAIAGDPQGLKHGIEQNVFQPQADEFHKAQSAVRGEGEFKDMGPFGRASSAVGHGLASALPLVGPAAAHAGERIGSGDIAGGLGESAGLLGNAAVPMLTKGIGSGLRSAAEPIAEQALGVRSVDRKFSRNPGRAALDETSGVRPGTVAKQATLRIGDLANQRDAALARSTASMDLSPVRAEVSNKIAAAKAGNSEVPDLEQIQGHLTNPNPGFNGSYTIPTKSNPQQLIAPIQTPENYFNLQRRLGEDYGKFDSSRPLSSESRNLANKAYGTMNEQLRSKVPEAATLNNRISNLIPIKDSAAVKDIQPGFAGQVAQRIAAKTGSLALGAYGMHEAGLPGLAAGVAIPELLGNPTAQMAAARTLNTTGNVLKKPIVGQAARATDLVRKRNQ